MGVNRIDEIGEKASEGHPSGFFGVGFTTGSLARNGARDGMR